MSAGTVVLLHAFPLDGRMWIDQADALSAAGWDVIVPDLPGFGESDLLGVEPDLAAVAETVIDELDAQGVQRAVIAGLSLGGYVAMALLRQAPERVAALILCDTKAAADTDTARENRVRIAEAVLAAPERTGRILRQSFLPGLLGPTTVSARPEIVEQVGTWLDEADADTIAWYQQAMAARPASFDVLAEFDAAALVLWGEADALSPEADQRAMLDVLQHGRAAVIADAGHLSAVESPDRVSEAMTAFLDSLTRGLSTS